MRSKEPSVQVSVRTKRTNVTTPLQSISLVAPHPFVLHSVVLYDTNLRTCSQRAMLNTISSNDSRVHDVADKMKGMPSPRGGCYWRSWVLSYSFTYFSPRLDVGDARVTAGVAVDIPPLVVNVSSACSAVCPARSFHPDQSYNTLRPVPRYRGACTEATRATDMLFKATLPSGTRRGGPIALI